MKPIRLSSARAVLVALLVLGSTKDAAAAIIATRSTSTPHPGVTLVTGTTRAPASRFHASLVALCHEGIRVDATAPPGASGNKTVPAWAQSTGAKVAVNGDFYKPGPRVYGVAAGGGAAWPVARTGVDPAVAGEWYYESFGWIAFGPGWVDFTHTEAVKRAGGALAGFRPGEVTHDLPPGTTALVSGFPELVTEGKRYGCASPTATTCFPDRADMRARHPRTAMGLSRDRRTFVLAVVDGRSSDSAGMYGTELAELMSELGAWQAFNLDGGGSSEMWVEGKGTVNKPSDGASRAVANHWGVFRDSGAGAHCPEASATSTTSELDPSEPELDDTPLASDTPTTTTPPPPSPSEPAAGAGCTTTRTGAGSAATVALALVALLGLRRRRA